MGDVTQEEVPTPEGWERTVVAGYPALIRTEEATLRDLQAAMQIEAERALLPPVLDACCGSRMFWFDKNDSRALYIDKRRETHSADLGTASTAGRAQIVVNPDRVADFTNMPFPSRSFHLVVFDPPHIEQMTDKGLLIKKYGVLQGDWRAMLAKGFEECFRVLKPNGTLIFKWGEARFPVSEILKLTPQKPLFGHKTRKTTAWVVFMKGAK